MDYDAVLVVRNTFLTLRLTNHDNDKEEVVKVAEQLADRLGATYLYTEEVAQ